MGNSTTPEERLTNLGLTLPTFSPPLANYVSYVQSSNLIHLAGQLSRNWEGKLITGKAGDTLTADQSYEAAKTAALQTIAALKFCLGHLSKVTHIVKMVGLVNATPDFEAHSQVMNGASDLLVAAFGDLGQHARTVFGVSSLPFGCAVEIELTVETSP